MIGLPASQISKFSFKRTALALLCGAMMAPAGFALAAEEQPGLYFYPAQGWKLEKQNTSCSVSAQFNNGFLMQIAGNEQGWVQALNINFRQDVFESGKDYDVKLGVPGVKEQMFKAKAINPQTLALGLAGQKEFYKAMSKASVLDFAVEQNNFRFYLTGFTPYADGFERCMAGSDLENAMNPKPPDIAVQNAQSQDQSKAADDYLVNEAIAMEESVKRAAGQLPEPSPDAPMTEISQDNPEPVAQVIPVKETKKLGDDVIADAQDAQAVAEEKIAEAQQSAETMAPKPLLDEDAAPIAEAEPMPEPMAKAVPEPSPEPILAAEMEAAPEPVAATMVAPAPGLVNKNAMTPERVQQLLAQQMGGEAPAAVMVDEAVAEAPVEAQTEMVASAETMTEAEATPAPQEPEALLPLDSAQEEPAPVIESAVADAVPEMPAAPPAPVVPVEEAPPVQETISTPMPVVNKQVASGQADFRATDMPPSASNQVMLDKIGELEALVEKLKAENVALNGDLKSTLRDSEEERLSISSDNWNLEQATMRFNESERQVKRLGQELQMERAKCTAEKKDLEASLFDPRITDQAQLARLADLEQQLAKAKDEIELQRMRYEEQIRLLRGASTTR